MYILSRQLLEQLLKSCQSDDVCLASLFGISPYRIWWTKRNHVEAQLGISDFTSWVSRLDHLWLLQMWALTDVQLGGVATLSSHPQILPQVMTVCQWLLRMWWEWELQEHVQHNPSVSWFMLFFPRHWLIDTNYTCGASSCASSSWILLWCYTI